MRTWLRPAWFSGVIGSHWWMTRRGCLGFFFGGTSCGGGGIGGFVRRGGSSWREFNGTSRSRRVVYRWWHRWNRGWKLIYESYSRIGRSIGGFCNGTSLSGAGQIIFASNTKGCTGRQDFAVCESQKNCLVGDSRGKILMKGQTSFRRGVTAKLGWISTQHIEVRDTVSAAITTTSRLIQENV